MCKNLMKFTALAATISAACSTHAQETDTTAIRTPRPNETDDSAVNASNTVELERIFVTSGKVKDDLQKSALSASVISGEGLRRRGLSSLATRIQDTPAVQIMGTGNANQGFFIAIRGVGYALSFGRDSPISMNVKGVFQQRAQAVSSTRAYNYQPAYTKFNALLAYNSADGR